jgi:hypothetical protein
MEDNENTLLPNLWVKTNLSEDNAEAGKTFHAALLSACASDDNEIKQKLNTLGYVFKRRGGDGPDSDYIDITLPSENSRPGVTVHYLTINPTGNVVGAGTPFGNDAVKAKFLHSDCESLRAIYAAVAGIENSIPHTFYLAHGRNDLSEETLAKIKAVEATLNHSVADETAEETMETEETNVETPRAKPADSEEPPLIKPSSTAGAEDVKGFHAYIDKHRDYLNEKLKGSNFTLENYTLTHIDGSKIDIRDNASMEADGIKFGGNLHAIENKLFEQLCEMLKIYSNLQAKNCIVPDPIKLNLDDDGKLTPEQKKQFEAMKVRIGNRIAAELKKPEYAGIKNSVRFLGKDATKTVEFTLPGTPGSAAAPKPSAPPADAFDAPAAPPPPLSTIDRDTLLRNHIKLPEIAIIQNNTINVENYVSNLDDTDPKKSAFIFPGNDGHASQNGIHDRKTGGGLADAADKLGQAGIGTLSLPTTFSSRVAENDRPDLAKKEMAKLWEAVARGYELVLPVRNASTHNDKFFNALDRAAIQNITNATDLEPSFWGNIQNEFAPGTGELHTYYTQQLGALQKFIFAWNDAPDKTAKENLLKGLDPLFRTRFENGLRLHADAKKAGPAPTQPSTQASTHSPGPFRK